MKSLNAELTKSAIEYFHQKGTKLLYKKGHLFNRPEDAAQGIYYLEEGQVLVYSSKPDGSEQIVGVFDEGAIFGKAGSLITKSPPYLFFEALINCVVYRILIDMFLANLGKNNQLLLGYLHQVSINNYYLVQHVLNLGEKDPYRRLLGWLYFITTIYDHNEQSDSVTPRLALTQEQIANFLNLSREHTNKTFKKITGKKLLTVQRGKLHIPSLAALRQELGYPEVES